MKRFGKRATRKYATALLALGALTGAVMATSASGVPITVGNIHIDADGSFSPKALPKHKAAPITLSLEGAVKTLDGSHIPPLRKLSLQFDKNGSIFTKGLPTCRYQQLTNTLTAQAQKACSKALIGTGKVNAELQFPDSPKQPASGKLLIFNGTPQGGKPVILAHAFVNNPVSTTVVTKFVITRTHGKYGTTTTATIPPLAGDNASLQDFTAKLHRTWKYKGKKVSLLTAKCPSGHLYAHGDFTFTDISLHGDVVKTCKPKG